MLKNGAPPDNFRVNYRLLCMEFYEQSNRILKVITVWFMVLSQIFIDGRFNQKFNFLEYEDE